MSRPPPPHSAGGSPGDTPSHVLPVSGLLGSHAPEYGSSVEPHSGSGDDQARTAGGKKRKTTAGTRGVANMTPDQLAKKRANDREAQRAIRERQRTRIEQYEREIAELKAQRSYQDVAAAQQETAAAKAEADHLRRVLASVVGIIQPVLHADTPQPAAAPPPPSYSGSTASPSSAATPLRCPDIHSPHPRHDPILAALSRQHCDPHIGLDLRLLHLCLLEHHHHLSAGHPPAAIVLGPPYPSVSSLLNPSSAPDVAHPLSRIFTDIIARFPSLRPLPERVAVLWIMFHLLRWEVSPTDAHRARVPVWLRPGAAQMARAHPAWINYLPWPRLREALVGFWEREPGVCRLENFFVPFTTSLSVNWGYEDVDCLLRVPGEGGEDGEGEVLINPVFERHIGRLENWTVGDAFYDAFPALGGTFNWKSERAGGVVRMMEEETGEEAEEGKGGRGCEDGGAK